MSSQSVPVFTRVKYSLVRDGTRLKASVEHYEQYGCFLALPDYIREVLDGKRVEAYGPWFVDVLYAKSKAVVKS